MKTNRRSFLSLGSLVACGTALNATSLVAAVSRMLPGAPPLCANGEAVLAYVRSYSADFRIVEVSRSGAGEIRGLHLVAEVADVGHWPVAMARVPFKRVRACGNTLAFALEKLNVTIENLTSSSYAARLASLS